MTLRQNDKQHDIMSSVPAGIFASIVFLKKSATLALISAAKKGNVQQVHGVGSAE